MPEIKGTPGEIVELSTQTGTQCFLTGIKGPFRYADSTDGVFIKYDSAAGRQRKSGLGNVHAVSAARARHRTQRAAIDRS